MEEIMEIIDKDEAVDAALDEAQATIEELEASIEGMRKDMEKKCSAAKEQLAEMLRITSNKYRTVTGAAEALRVLRFVAGDDYDNYELIVMAGQVAIAMADETVAMIQAVDDLDCGEMDKLCEDFYEPHFEVSDNATEAIWDMAFEMMRIDLCRNVGGSAEDMVEFIKHVEQDIAETQAKIDELKGE